MAESTLSSGSGAAGGMAGLVAEMALELAGLPQDRQIEAQALLLGEYRALLAKQFPDRADEQQFFVTRLFSTLQRQLDEITTTTGGGVGGLA